MNITLIRDAFTEGPNGATTGRLYVDGLAFGFTCEDVDRGLVAGQSPAELAAAKVHGKTAIPVGRYRVAWAWSERFGHMTPRLLDVPGFAGVLIHPGNTAADTEGCLLPGTVRAHPTVGHSRAACDWLYPRIEAACAAGPVWISVDRDAAAWTGRG